MGWSTITFLGQQKVPPEHAQWVFNVGIKIRVSTWSHLFIVRPLQIPFPIREKKIWVQQENL
jgi:hypothetical protein